MVRDGAAPLLQAGCAGGCGLRERGRGARAEAAEAGETPRLSRLRPPASCFSLAAPCFTHARRDSHMHSSLSAQLDELKVGMAQMPPKGGGVLDIFAADLAAAVAAAGAAGDVVELLSDDDD